MRTSSVLKKRLSDGPARWRARASSMIRIAPGVTSLSGSGESASARMSSQSSLSAIAWSSSRPCRPLMIRFRRCWRSEGGSALAPFVGVVVGMVGLGSGGGERPGLSAPSDSSEPRSLAYVANRA